MIANIRKLAEFAPDEFGRAQMAETQVEVKECQRRCPVDSGDMQSEIHAEGPFREGRRIITKIATGEKSADYALIQHEDLDLFHKVGEAKFIERPLMESAPHMAARIAARIDLTRYKDK